MFLKFEIGLYQVLGFTFIQMHINLSELALSIDLDSNRLRMRSVPPVDCVVTVSEKWAPDENAKISHQTVHCLILRKLGSDVIEGTRSI
jgi:hypothetical protein